MSELRPYQVTAIDSALAALSNSGSAVLQMPTGAGKTRAATEITKRWDGVVWFICHRVEIAQQAAKAFKAAGIDFGMISPRAIDPETGKRYSFEPAKRVQIIMVGSLARRMADLPAPSLVIWDECHHVAAKSWAAIREQLSDTKHLGLTATPERLDGKGLAEWFAELVTGPTIESLIADEWLSPFRYFAPSEPDLSAAKMQAGDYDKKDLARIMNAPVLIGDAVAEYRRVANGKRAIAFCASVDASRALVARFNAEGVPALHVDGDTAQEARGEAVKALSDGDIKILSNVEVFTEGFDVPGIEAVILMRPTKSPTLLLQMIGRALRFVEGKTAVIMDHAGLWQDHGWFADDWHWSIDGGAAMARRSAGVRGPRCCPACKEVRAERVPVCEACGFEFPTGREIGEFDGVLREVRGEVPEGCETVYAFAKRHGVSWTLVKLWVRRGLPCVLGYINTSEGDAWVSRNVDKDRLALAQNKVSVSHGEVSAAKFAEMIGVSDGTVHRLIRSKGLPTTKTGKICITGGVQWVADNQDEIERIKKVGSGMRRAPSGFLSMVKFAKRHGKHSALTVQSWIGLGLPHRGRFIPIKEGDEWMNRNQDRLPSAIRLGDLGRTSKKSFGRIIGFSGGHSLRVVNAMERAGLPYDPKLGIPILPALEWVRDNRPDIVIPPDAWPSANDNPPPAAEAA